jgi:hypothetical protein
MEAAEMALLASLCRQVCADDPIQNHKSQCQTFSINSPIKCVAPKPNLDGFAKMTSITKILFFLISHKKNTPKIALNLFKIFWELLISEL